MITSNHNFARATISEFLTCAKFDLDSQGHFVYAPRQRETTLHRKVVSDWLFTYINDTG